ncbi:methyl-accepting chemotaxis protein [Lysinibacillus odysseyi]|uniref:Chemotaxis protein n=1 Tax=Lysinibacillus odysseyi 34hs-1 = NBRC 100172 TaxID=1220589 RepID=A0A0A3IH29_9BACI|nr:methyl-accepting chemotaxis protein [Lysinibacillus odysseyi]KGR82128.1 hypothetical protein CD32_22830 [Lysinibacillus odysseyi 34hs-1 = NBRC 100172]
MSITKKLLLGFITMMVITVLSGIGIYLQVINIDQQYDKALSEGLPQIYDTSDLDRYIVLEGSQLQTYLLGDVESLDHMRETEGNINKTLQSIASQYNTEKSKKALANTEEKVKAFQKEIDHVVDLNQNKDVFAAAAYYTGSLLPVRDEVIAASNELSEEIKVFFDQAQQEADKRSKQAFLIAIGVIVLSILVGSAIAYKMNNMIAKPLRVLQNAVMTIAAGDLTSDDLQIRSKDELGQLAASFNTMKNTLKGLLSQLMDNARHLSASAEQLSASTEEVTASSTELAVHAEETSHNTMNSAKFARENAVAMEETAAAVERIADSSTTLQDSAAGTLSVANQGAVDIQSAGQQMDAIYESTKLTTDLIQRLSKQSEDIENISKVITSITAQTNLLALNAAIEAARAGEAGKGFAVVADEVRKLAEESGQSAGQIVTLTNEIQADTRNVERAVQESLRTVETGVNVINNAGASFQKIVNEIDNMKLQIEEISAVTEEISASAKHVSQSVTEIAVSSEATAEQAASSQASSQQQLSTLQEVTAVANDLSGQAIDLQGLVNNFKI